MQFEKKNIQASKARLKDNYISVYKNNTQFDEKQIYQDCFTLIKNITALPNYQPRQ